MNCSSPFLNDDSTQIGGSPPIGRCRVCGDVHRLDLGCPIGDSRRSSFVVAWIVGCVLFAAGFCLAWWVAR